MHISMTEGDYPPVKVDYDKIAQIVNSVPDAPQPKKRRMTAQEEYWKYLHSPVWIAHAEKCMNLAGGLCLCGKRATQVHHIRYTVNWRNGEVEPLENLEAVCDECHKKRHTCRICGKFKGSEVMKDTGSICRGCRDATKKEGRSKKKGSAQKKTKTTHTRPLRAKRQRKD